jgi:hypothetical protein
VSMSGLYEGCVLKSKDPRTMQVDVDRSMIAPEHPA